LGDSLVFGNFEKRQQTKLNMTTAITPTKLNLLQQNLLQLFGRQTVSEADLKAIQKIVADYFFDQAEEELEKIWIEKELSQSKLDSLAEAHLRTPYSLR
jgi:hypothetical protein